MSGADGHSYAKTREANAQKAFEVLTLNLYFNFFKEAANVDNKRNCPGTS